MDCGGLLLSQLNSYQKESFNTVVSCEKIPDSNNYLAVLDDTVLYPEGGGQPWDLGDVNGVEVLKVLKGPGNNKHVQVELAGPVEVGASVKSTVNWERRYDHMQQHTSQHVFSAIADKLFKAETVGWGLSPDSVTVDLSLGGNTVLTSEQLDEIERETNAFIRTGALVSFKIYKPSDLTSQDNTDPALEVLRGAPKGAALELSELRMVNVEGLDLNPCGGTHLHSVSEINLLKIIGTEKNRGSLRVRYLAGDRAARYFGEALTREAALSTKLSVPPQQFVAQVDKLLKERKDNSKKFDVYSEELAGFWGASLATAAAAGDKPNFVVKHRVGADLKFLVKAGESVLAVNPGAFVFLSGDEQMPSATSQAQNNGKKMEALSGPYVVFGDKDVVNKVKAELQTIINGRGGGKPGRMQGVAQNLENFEKLNDYLKTAV